MAKPKPYGRQTLLTPQVHETIVNAVRIGAYLDDAASLAGISRGTLFRWLAEGRDANDKSDAGEEITDRETLCRDFCDAVEKARADAMLRNIGVIQTAAQNGTWQAAAWYLERTNPKKWGRHDTVEVTGADGGAIQVEVSVKDTLRAKFEAAERAALDVIEGEVIDDESPKELRATK
jgi:hypothetical protein